MDTTKVMDISPKPKPEVKKTAVSSKADDSFSVPVRTTLTVPSQPAESVPTVDNIAPHHSISIKPPSEASSVAVENSSPESTEITSKVASEATPKVAPEPSQDTPTPVAPEPAPEPDSMMSTDSSKQDSMQAPIVFDTKQYNLPIDEHKSHNSTKHIAGFILVFLLSAVVFGVLAVDAGLINLGFNLPFDFI